MKSEKQNSSSLGWFGKMMLWLNIAAALVLLCCYGNSFFSPKQIWWLGFLGLGFPIIASINFLFFGYWLLRLRKWMLISLLATLPGYNYLQQTFAFGKQQIVLATDSSVVKIMSYNVRIFNLYDWDKNIKEKDNIINLIQQEHPQIICFQEFYTSESKDQPSFNIINQLKNKLGYKYFYFEKTYTKRKTDHWGTAIFSNFPIVDSGKVSFGFGKQNSCCFADLLIHNKTYRVFDMHLQSIHLANSDYDYLDNVKMENDSDLIASKNILRKLKRAFLRRSSQVDKVAAAISSSKSPVIVCGDFNDTPTSYTYQTIGSGLKDVFLESGKGIGKTYVGLFPTLRIDFIFTDKKIESLQTRVIEKAFSDHYPVVSYLKL